MNESCHNNRLHETTYFKKQNNRVQPWMTKGLQNACKKKNTLYRTFIKHRTKELENKYEKNIKIN